MRTILMTTLAAAGIGLVSTAEVSGVVPNAHTELKTTDPARTKTAEVKNTSSSKALVKGQGQGQGQGTTKAGRPREGQDNIKDDITDRQDTERRTPEKRKR
jgi:hypothetical protein